MVACGRAAPGSTLARRKDPDVAAHDVTHRECTDLEYHKRPRTEPPQRPRDNESFDCEKWETTSVDHVAAVHHDPVDPGAGPAPPFSFVPVAAIGHSVAESGADSSAGYWLSIDLQAQLIPHPDRFSVYASLGYLVISNQGDLGGFDLGGGAMVALTSSWILDVHAAAVAGDNTGLHLGGGVRWRPFHYVSRDLTIGVSLEDVRGADTQTTLPPIMMVHNHSTGIVLDASGGLLR